MTSSPNGYQNPQQPESQISSLRNLREYGRDITSTVRAATHNAAIRIVDLAEADDRSYQEQAKAAMEVIIAEFNAADDETAETLRNAYFPLLLGYFLDRERDVPGPDTFTVKDFHFMDSRAKGNFHGEFLAYGATILPQDQDDRHHVDLAMKCREFQLNGARRRAQDEGKTQELAGIAASVEDLLEHWEALIDDPHYAQYAHDSLARLHTELGFIAKKLDQKHVAGDHYAQAGVNAEKAGDRSNAIFSHFEQQDLLLKMGQNPFEVIAAMQQLQARAEELFATVRTVRNAGLVANAHLFVAGAHQVAGAPAKAEDTLQALEAKTELFDLLAEQAADFHSDIAALRQSLQGSAE